MKDKERHPRVFTQTFCVVGAIIKRRGKILLVQEAQGFSKGQWNQPAGWVDPGEDPLKAVIREIKEETGFDFKPEGIIGIYSIVQKRPKELVSVGLPHAIKIIYRGAVSNQIKDLTEDVAKISWYTPDEIEDMDVDTLRDMDIKQEVTDFLAGKSYPLDLVHHTVQDLTRL